MQRLLGLSGNRDGLVMIRDLLGSDILGELTAAPSALRAAGELKSTVLVRPTAGATLSAEYHVRWDVARRGQTRLALRSFADRDEQGERRAIHRSSLGVLGTRTRRQLLEGARRRDLAPRERLTGTLGGEPWAVVVLSGLVRVYLGVEGREPTLFYRSGGALLGTHWPLGEQITHFALQAITAARLLSVDPARVTSLATSDPFLARATANDMGIAFRDVLESYGTRATASLATRLAREILVLANALSDPWLLPVTEQQLADGVGTLRESVGRTIASFRRRGLVATTRNGIIVLNPDGLRIEATH